MASRGMPNTTQLASSCAIVNALAFFISRRPSAPSSPIPVIKMPTALAPAAWATDRNSTLTLGDGATQGSHRAPRGNSPDRGGGQAYAGFREQCKPDREALCRHRPLLLFRYDKCH